MDVAARYIFRNDYEQDYETTQKIVKELGMIEK
jgi:hypothetical protein